MEANIPFAFFLIALLIPPALLVVGGINYIGKIEIKEIILKLFLSFLAYLSVTALIVLYIVSLINATAEANGNALDAKSEVIHFAVILMYGVFGFILFLFAKSDLKQTLSIFHRSPEDNNRTIFGAK